MVVVVQKRGGLNMARFLGKACKSARRIGTDLGLKRLGSGRDISTKCKLSTPPGQHGAKKSRATDYGLMLRAKQMLKFMYGVLERQFRGYYKEASRRSGTTGEILLELLERRLDNVVYRMGFAATRAEARQLVKHKAIAIKGLKEADFKVVNVPSYLVSNGDEVRITDKAKGQTRIQDALKCAQNLGIVDWVAVNVNNLHGVFKNAPSRKELPAEINEQLVVEFYSK